MPSLRRYMLSMVCLLACCAATAAPSEPAVTAAQGRADGGQPRLRQLADGALAGATALAQGQTGFIWLGTPQGLLRWDGKRAHRYQAKRGEAGALPDQQVLSLHRDSDGRLWVGTANGLARFDAQAGRFLVFPAGPGGLADGRIAAMTDDGRGGLWVGSGAGLEHVRADGRMLSAASGAPRLAAAALGGSGVDALLRDRSGGLWIGTRAGLFHRPADTQPIAPVGLGDARDAAISALQQDAKGRIWIGTRTNGAFVLDPSGGPVRRIGAPHEQVLALAERAPELMWIGLADGAIIEWNSRNQDAQRLHLDHPAAALLRERSGQMFIATPAALMQLDPPMRAAVPSRIAVTRLLVDGHELPVAPFNAPIATRAAVQLTPEQRARGFELEFAALDYSQESGELSYKLKGYDADWVAADGQGRRAAYTNLPPGEYALQLRSGRRQPGTGGDAAVHTLTIQVQPAWHEYLLVRVLAVLAVLGGAGALVHARITRLRAQQAALQSALDARAVEMRVLREEIDVLTHSDALTGLANRRRFGDEIQLLADEAADGGERFTLLLFDLDRFGDINAAHGYATGDAVLVEIAQRLKRTMRDGDLVGRFGDDEFAVLMPLSLPADIIERICTRIRNNLSKPISVGDLSVQVNASVGAASFISSPGAVQRLYKTAGIALADAKQAARAARDDSQREAA